MPEHDAPLKVYVSFYIGDIDAIDTVGQSFDAKVFVRYRWLDKRLAHDSKHAIEKPLDSIWHPNIQIVNQQRVWQDDSNRADISGAGMVTYRNTFWGSFSQKLYLSTFPFDKQDFTFQIAALGYSPEDIEFIGEKQAGGAVTFAVTETPSISDWQIADLSFNNHSIKPVPTTDIEIAGMAFTFEAKRLTAYYIVKMILPLILIVAMSWAVFWMDAKNVASNVGISITSMLTLIAYRFSADSILPRLSYLTSLDYFILASTILVFLSLLQCLVSSALAVRDQLERSHRLDIIARIVFPVIFILVILETLVYRFFA